MERQDTRGALTTLAEVRDLGTIPVWHQTRPNAAAVLGVSRTTIYAMAKSGDLPTLRLGARLVVPVPALRRMLGDLESPSNVQTLPSDVG